MEMSPLTPRLQIKSWTSSTGTHFPHVQINYFKLLGYCLLFNSWCLHRCLSLWEYTFTLSQYPQTDLNNWKKTSQQENGQGQANCRTNPKGKSTFSGSDILRGRAISWWKKYGCLWKEKSNLRGLFCFLQFLNFFPNYPIIVCMYVVCTHVCMWVGKRLT